MSQRKIVNILSLSMLAALLVSFFVDDGGRIMGATVLAIAAAATLLFVKKRSIHSFMKDEVAFLMAIMGLVYVMLYFLTGVAVGFRETMYSFRPEVIEKYIIPITVIIVASELVRSVMRAQENKVADVISYFSLVVAEVVMHYSISQIFSYSRFVDIIAQVFLPALINNLLYHYLSKRYGVVPNIAYRLITTLYMYIIPYESKIADSLMGLASLIVPIVIFIFIDYLYEKKKKYALSKNTAVSTAITVVVVILMSSLVMLVSNTFEYGAYVIATESMTGDLNKGDIAVYERYDEDDKIVEGDIIVFESEGKYVIHRVVDIAYINGETRYYTKGDANEDLDVGYVVDGDVAGVVEVKLPYLGYPTLWLRELINGIV